jgi:DNA-binding LacI/PurR family transcriptional regulator
MYVVAPIPHKKTAAILSTLPMNKFLMVDRYEPMEGDYSYIVQEFEKSSYKALVQLKDVIGRYKEMVYYHKLPTDIPVEILNAYKKFVKDHKINGVVQTEYIPGSIEKGKVYFTVSNTELWTMLKDCISKKYVIGKDVGILSHNDEVVKEIICNGITTYSTDFQQMAEKAADFVKTREKIREVIPTVLIRRQSL